MGDVSFNVMLLSGPLMILVALGFVLGWKKISGAGLRWFLAGAATWAVGVGLKVLVSRLLNPPMLEGLQVSLPLVPYLVVSSTYVGLMTGVFEIGVTLAMAWKWQSWARDANRAVAVGIGAGAFEAVLLGAASLIGTLSYASAGAPLAWLVGPVERITATLCHTSSRTLVLLTVAKRGWSFFWYGFLLVTAMDGIAGLIHLSGILEKVSMWWIQLGLTPFALVSVLIIIWCVRHWPVDTGEETDKSATAASTDEAEGLAEA